MVVFKYLGKGGGSMKHVKSLFFVTVFLWMCVLAYGLGSLYAGLAVFPSFFFLDFAIGGFVLFYIFMWSRVMRECSDFSEKLQNFLAFLVVFCALCAPIICGLLADFLKSVHMVSLAEFLFRFRGISILVFFAIIWAALAIRDMLEPAHQQV